MTAEGDDIGAATAGRSDRGLGGRRFTRILCAGALLVSALTGSSPAAWATSPDTAPTQATSDVRWVEITPLVGEGPVRLLRYAPGEPADQIALQGAGRQLVCLGGETAGRPWALRCEQHLVEDGATVSLTWEEGVVLEGRVRVEREPAPGSRVTVLPADLRTVRVRSTPLHWDEEGGKLVRHVETAPDGRFSLPPLAPGEYILALQLPGGRLVHTEVMIVPAPAELRRRSPRSDAPSPAVLDVGDLAFQGGAALRILTLDPGGLPLEGVQVGVAQEDLDGGMVSFEARSDEEGVARVSGLDPLQPIRVSCGGPGLRWRHWSFETLPVEHVCSLERLARLSGQVVDPEGEPEAATIHLSGRGSSGMADGNDIGEPATGEDIERTTAASKDTGLFTFHDLPAGDYELTAAASGFAGAEVAVRLKPGEERTLKPLALEVGRPWEGIVVDGTTEVPVPGARVRAVEPPGAFETVTDGEGLFQAVTGVDRPLRLEVEASGYPPTVREIGVRELAGDGPARLEIEAGGFLEVQYWTAEGDPCGGCSVGVTGPSGNRELVTDGSGGVRSPVLAPGRYQVTPVELRSYGAVVSRSGGSRNRFATVRPRSVERVVIGEARPLVEVEIWPPPPSGWRLRVAGDLAGEIHEIGTAGRATVRWPTGPVQLLLWTPEGGQVELARVSEAPGDGGLAVELPTGGVSGRVLRDGTPPSSGSHVTLVDLAEGRVRARGPVGADGGFDLRFVPSGTYAVTLGDQMVRTTAVGDRSEDLGDIEIPAMGP